jgi:transcription elongation factor Elf1
MTLTAFECPACGHRDIVKDDDHVETDDRGRPRCSACGMPMLPVTLVPGNREETAQVYAKR